MYCPKCKGQVEITGFDRYNGFSIRRCSTCDRLWVIMQSAEYRLETSEERIRAYEIINGSKVVR